MHKAIVNYEVEEGGEQRATPLSDDFDGAVQDAANGLLGAIQDGSLKLRLDFDTSMGDETYTKLKLSTEFAARRHRVGAGDGGRREFGALLPGRGGRRSSEAGVEDG